MEMAAKPVRWIGSSRRDLRSFPRQVKRDIGQALYAAQEGKLDPAAKPLKGFGGSGVLEIAAPHDGNTWRTVYTVQFRDAVYVLRFSEEIEERRRYAQKRD